MLGLASMPHGQEQRRPVSQSRLLGDFGVLKAFGFQGDVEWIWETEGQLKSEEPMLQLVLQSSKKKAKNQEAMQGNGV
jgi:hypothetical protein